MRERRALVLAMLKLGFRPDEVLAMPFSEVEGYLAAYGDIVNGKAKEKTYVVRRDEKRKKSRS
jgi:hypothetical protein